MPKTRDRNSIETVDDMYLAYVHVLSADDDAEFAEFVAEYTAPADDSAPVSSDIRHPLTTTLQNPVRKNFPQAA